MKRNIKTRLTETDIIDDRVIRPITMKELKEFKRLLDQAERDLDYEIQH